MRYCPRPLQVKYRLRCYLSRPCSEWPASTRNRIEARKGWYDSAQITRALFQAFKFCKLGRGAVRRVVPTNVGAKWRVDSLSRVLTRRSNYRAVVFYQSWGLDSTFFRPHQGGDFYPV